MAAPRPPSVSMLRVRYGCGYKHCWHETQKNCKRGSAGAGGSRTRIVVFGKEAIDSSAGISSSPSFRNLLRLSYVISMSDKIVTFVPSSLLTSSDATTPASQLIA
ncbi:uncharacterized protein LOC109821580 [Asparagus officinalis]|uniref:uncharacterized protein LOC109821580 n=1 Tax=Asparagus officinalis TaxID=4686 RepID=UPI00098DF282|nr:uncharacterized protein LOC109821580 [Asparagus officinalis]